MSTWLTFSPQGKVVLVTGGAKGIGRMISEGYVANGAKVYISSRDAASCEKAASELTDKGPGSAVALPANLQSLDECTKLASDLAAREPRLHILVNNSGATWGASIEEHPDSAWTKLLTLNLQRVFTLTQLLLPLLEKAATAADPARIINIGSIDALRVPVLTNFAYAASKAGLHHLSRTLAVELGKRHITSNTIACGPFPSKMMAATLDAAGEAIKEASPLGRIGQPEDVAGACLWLSSQAGAFVNGATVPLDGGISLVSKM
ncbi:hypothetical protein MCOR25_002392 [Pyricularia grisea]|nr:hypothetical protein MCOR25_002392 [Pyricularia grisea]